MLNNIQAFEKFYKDGAVYNPDMYLSNELEDFSPEAAVNTAYIDSFAERTPFEFAYDLIA